MTDEIMETSQTVGTGVDTEGDKVGTQETSKKFSQEELNAIVAKRVAQEQKKYEGVDLSEYQELKTAKQKADEEQMMKRNEFEKVLKLQKEKSDEEINKLKSELTKVRVDGALVNAASKHKATNPEHVAMLLRNNVRLGDDGNPVVLNESGEIRYDTNTAEPFGIDNLVEEFINSNPYFKAPGKSGTSSASNTQSTTDKDVSLENLDLTRPEHREIYKKMKAEGKI